MPVLLLPPNNWCLCALRVTRNEQNKYQSNGENRQVRPREGVEWRAGKGPRTFTVRGPHFRPLKKQSPCPHLWCNWEFRPRCAAVRGVSAAWGSSGGWWGWPRCWSPTPAGPGSTPRSRSRCPTRTSPRRSVSGLDCGGSVHPLKGLIRRYVSARAGFRRFTLQFMSGLWVGRIRCD